MLITDGEPDECQDIATLAERIKEDTAHKRYAFLPIGVDNANMSVLQSIQGQIPAMKLKGTKFSSFFKWLSGSMEVIVSGGTGQKINISNGASDWMDSYTI